LYTDLAKLLEGLHIYTEHGLIGSKSGSVGATEAMAYRNGSQADTDPKCD